MKDIVELANECEDAEIWNIFVSSKTFTFEMSRKISKGSGCVYLTVPRSLDLKLKPELDQSVFEKRIEYEVFFLRDFFGVLYLIEILPDNVLRISHCNVGTMFSITAMQNIESPSTSWQLVEEKDYKDSPCQLPSDEESTKWAPPMFYLKELENMQLEKIVFRIDTSILHFKKDAEERTLIINSEIQFTGNLLKKFEKLKSKFPDEEIGARMSVLAGCIDSKIQKIDLKNSADLEINFDDGTSFIAVEKAPEGNPYFEESWALLNAKTGYCLVLCVDGEGGKEWMLERET